MERLEEERVETREQLAAYIRALHQELSGGTAWKNPTLERYLEALAAWLEDMPGWFANQGAVEPRQPTWSLIAQMLRAATIYE